MLGGGELFWCEHPWDSHSSKDHSLLLFPSGFLTSASLAFVWDCFVVEAPGISDRLSSQVTHAPQVLDHTSICLRLKQKTLARTH